MNMQNRKIWGTIERIGIRGVVLVLLAALCLAPVFPSNGTRGARIVRHVDATLEWAAPQRLPSISRGLAQRTAGSLPNVPHTAWPPVTFVFATNIPRTQFVEAMPASVPLSAFVYSRPGIRAPPEFPSATPQHSDILT